jgi:hypothetical protein
MVREMKNLVGASSTSSFVSLNNNYLANGSVSSFKNIKGNNINKTRRIPGNANVPQSYYHRSERNGVKQIVKETQYPNKFNKNIGFSVIPQSNPTNFDSINNLYQNICKNYEINTNKSVAVDIPEVSNEVQTIDNSEKIALVQGELDNIETIRNQMTSIQNQLQNLNGGSCEDITSSVATLASNSIDFNKYKSFIKETRNVIDQLQQLNSFNYVSNANTKQSSSNLTSLKSALTSSNNTSQIYDILSSTSFHSFAMFKKTFANNSVNQPLKNYEKFVDLINENFYVQKEINQRNLNLQKTNHIFSMINQHNLDEIQVVVKEGIRQVKELENNLLQMERSVITTSDEVEIQTESIEKINESIVKTKEILDKLRNDYKKELKEHEKIINYHKRIIDSIENSKRHVSVLTDVSIICFSIWLSNKFIVKYPIDLMAQSITKSKAGQKVVAVIIKVTLIILLTIQIRKFLKTNTKYNLIQYCFDLILNYHKRKYIEDEDAAAKASLESITDSNETLVESE